VGRGSDGVVYKGTLEDGHVAIKEMRISELKSMEKFEREIEMMRRIEHENIVEFIAVVMDRPKFYMISEYMDGPSLHARIHASSDQYTGEQAINWLTQAAKGLAYLHAFTPVIIHRDVKPKNMLLDNYENTLKLCDFGTVREYGTKMTKNIGTVIYMAPEVFDSNIYTEKCDIYSLAITIYEVFSRKEPYDDVYSNEFTFLEAVSRENLRPLRTDLRECPPHIETLMECSWKPNPKDR
ncbi:hypothetical protein KR093_008677, partial [Drosophila rubida]